ncbi:MAG: PQQ-binding-like beta-propeller repeat protein [Planctomycetota bacterium]|nr:PQQ-binding-like beta-propeller repeat protein [Planctomycetota bacterium]
MCPQTSTSPQGGTSAGGAPCRWKARTRRSSGANESSAPARRKSSGEVYCFDADKGHLLWRRDVPLPAGAENVTVFDDTGWSPSTAATDGQLVAAIFPTMDLACFDVEGKPLWSKNLGAVSNQYGHASSLLMVEGKVIVQFDQREDADRASRSKLLAFDAATGKKAWETARPTEAAWSSPILADAPGGTQLVVAGNPWAIAYRPGSGEELWRAKVLGGDGAASPVYAAGLVLAGNTGTGLSGIRPDGRGDVTKTHVAWTIADALGDVASPVCDGRRVYMTKTDGELGCFAIDGAKPVLLWKQQFEMPFQASPTLAGRGIYLLAEKGTLIVFQAGAGAYKELARSELGEDCPASPAFVDGRIYIRGKKNLYCIESPGK